MGHPSRPPLVRRARVFRPERWADGLARRIPRYAYFPFGGGPRICIGNHFAQMEAVLLLATIARRFRPRVPPGTIVRPIPTMTLRPEGGVPVVLEERRPRLIDGERSVRVRRGEDGAEISVARQPVRPSDRKTLLASPEAPELAAWRAVLLPLIKSTSCSARCVCDRDQARPRPEDVVAGATNCVTIPSVVARPPARPIS